MRSSLRHGVIALALMRGVTLAGAAESTNTGSTRADLNTGAGSHARIGATGHTMPAKFSAENDALDKISITGRLPLTADQARMLRDSLVAPSQPDAGFAAVGPATVLPADVAIHDLP